MLQMPFRGKQRLIEQLDAAMAGPDDASITDAVRHVMCALIRDPDVRLPSCVLEPLADHYARRPLYHSVRHGYSVIAMTWGPGQGTPIHDHAGMWCVEGVWHGQLEITQYDLLDEKDEGCAFRVIGNINAGFGSAGSLIPPFEYHAIRNPSTDTVAVSLHVYKGKMRRCGVFHPTTGGRYRRSERELSFDALG